MAETVVPEVPAQHFAFQKRKENYWKLLFTFWNFLFNSTARLSKAYCRKISMQQNEKEECYHNKNTPICLLTSGGTD